MENLSENMEETTARAIRHPPETRADSRPDTDAKA